MYADPVRDLEYQNPMKEKLTREINRRCEEKLRHKAKTKNKLARLSRNLIRHTSNTEMKPRPDPTTVPMYQKSSIWENLIEKTQKNNDYFHKGSFKRSVERGREDSQTRRTIEPSYEPPKQKHNYDVYYKNPPQTVKHKSSKALSFKPPLAPNKAITGCGRRHHEVNNRSSFKLHYTENDLKGFTPKSLSNKRVKYKRKEKPVVYPLGIYSTTTIKDSAKHVKSMSTSKHIKRVREHQSSLVTLPGNFKEVSKDQPELLEYNLKTKNIELKNKKKERIKVLHKSDVNQKQNIGHPIQYAGLKRKGEITTKGSLSKTFYDSQIVFGADENYMPMKTQKVDYSKLRLSSPAVKKTKMIQETSTPRSVNRRGQRPESARNMFGSHFRIC